MPPRRLASLLPALRATLERGEVPDAHAEARDIVAALTSTSRFWPSANLDAEVGEDIVRQSMRAAERRAAGEPFAYAVGRAAFRHLTLMVDRRVLIPRQETEMLVEIVLEKLRDTPGGTAVDVGTGSGAIALALAQEGRLDRIIATDVSQEALAVAAANVEAYRSRVRAPVELRHGASLEPVLGERVRAVVANPPYIALHESAELPDSVRNWEPTLALYSAEDGMAATAALIAEAPAVLEPGGLLAIELDSRRADRALSLATEDGRYRDARISPDLTGRDRVLTARLADASGQGVTRAIPR